MSHTLLATETTATGLGCIRFRLLANNFL